MNHWILLVVLIISGGFIVYQDFRSRRISVWLIILFSIASVTASILSAGIEQYFNQALICALYLMFCYATIHLYFYVKEKRFTKIIDNRVGLGDVLLAFIVGSCLPPEHLIYFFTIAFLVAIVFSLIFLRKSSTIPLAGILIPVYFLYLLLIGVALL